MTEIPSALDPHSREVWAMEVPSLYEVYFLPGQGCIGVDCTHWKQCRGTRVSKGGEAVRNGANFDSVPVAQESGSPKALSLQP